MTCRATQPQQHWEIQGGCFENPDNGLVMPIHGVSVFGQDPPKPLIRSYLPFQYGNEGCFVASHRTPWADAGLSSMFDTKDPFQNSAPPEAVTKYADVLDSGYPQSAQPTNGRCQ